MRHTNVATREDRHRHATAPSAGQQDAFSSIDVGCIWVRRHNAECHAHVACTRNDVKPAGRERVPLVCVWGASRQSRESVHTQRTSMERTPPVCASLASTQPHSTALLYVPSDASSAWGRERNLNAIDFQLPQFKCQRACRSIEMHDVATRTWPCAAASCVWFVYQR
jgi:hypothetical protein